MMFILGSKMDISFIKIEVTSMLFSLQELCSLSKVSPYNLQKSKGARASRYFYAMEGFKFVNRVSGQM